MYIRINILNVCTFINMYIYVYNIYIYQPSTALKSFHYATTRRWDALYRKELRMTRSVPNPDGCAL